VYHFTAGSLFSARQIHRQRQLLSATCTQVQGASARYMISTVPVSRSRFVDNDHLKFADAIVGRSIVTEHLHTSIEYWVPVYNTYIYPMNTRTCTRTRSRISDSSTQNTSQ